MITKFDGNLAWKQASAALAANRELLLALAGVFFLLPSLAFGLFLPQPEPTPGASPDQMMATMQVYYLSVFPYMLGTALIQATGTLAVLTLFTDRTRPTVGQAIKLGLGGLFSYLAAQLLLGIGLGVVGSLVLGVGALTGSQVLVGLLIVALLVGVLYVAVKTSLVAPIVAVERERNPVAALRRSWRLTRGNSVRVALFYLLFLVAFGLIFIVAMALIGIVLALVASGSTATTIATVISSALGAVMTLYFAAILAAVHRQLAGPSAERISAPFE